jgi:hypothetical protein
LISYFAVDLLIKAIQVIEVCRAEAQTTGQDLKRSLMSLTAAKRVGVLVLCLLVPTLALPAEGRCFRLRQSVRSDLTSAPGVALVRRSFPRWLDLSEQISEVGSDALPNDRHSQTADACSSNQIILASLKLASPPSEGDRIPDSELNERIDRELSGSEYSWRKPHHLVSSEKNWLHGFVTGIAKSLGKVSRAINQAVAIITKWWQSLFPHPEGPTQLANAASAPTWITQLLLYAIICGLIIAAALIALRILARSKKKMPVGSAMPVTPNLESETTVADELPEDQWLLLARRKLEEGEPRLALRALFLAVLSLLGAQRLIIVRRSKSNSDYETELRRRRSAELTELFTGNRRLFERCWYGNYPVTDVEIEQSTHFYQRLKHACLAEK